MRLPLFSFFLLLVNLTEEVLPDSFDDEHVVKAPTACEVCKLFCHEFMLRFNATDSSAMLEVHGTGNKKIPYSTSYSLFSFQTYIENCD